MLEANGMAGPWKLTRAFQVAAINPSNSHITPCSTYAHKQSTGSSAAAAPGLPEASPAFFTSAPEKKRDILLLLLLPRTPPHRTEGTRLLATRNCQQELLAVGTPRESLPVIHLFKYDQKSKLVPNLVVGRQKMRAEPLKKMGLFMWNQFGSKLEDSQKRRKKMCR